MQSLRQNIQQSMFPLRRFVGHNKRMSETLLFQVKVVASALNTKTPKRLKLSVVKTLKYPFNTEKAI
jgi:hypothetical protein